MPFEYGAVFSAARLISDGAKKIQDLTKSSEVEIEKVRIEVSAMRDHAITMQQASGDSDEEIRRLRRQLDDRSRLEALEDDVAFEEDGSFNIRKSERAAGITNALCPVCWGDGKKLVPMLRGESGSYHCALHKAVHWTKAATQDYDRRRRESADSAMPRGATSTSWMG